MKKAILMSIKSNHLYNILTKSKSLELRKSVPKGFVGWVYLYCTKAKPYLTEEKQPQLYGTPFETKHFLDNSKIDFTEYTKILNGKVVARFWYDEYTHYLLEKHNSNIYALKFDKEDRTASMEQGTTKQLIDNSCAGIDKIWGHSKPYKGSEIVWLQKHLYAWHIKKLEIFDTPKELSEFYNKDLSNYFHIDYDHKRRAYEKATLKRAPQSYQFVYVEEEKNE